jgi:hypothetical protein
MWLAVHGAFRPLWTEQIHHEWIDAALRNNPTLKRERLDKTRQLMELATEGATIVGFEGLIDHLELPDPNDRHVLAAAIFAEADFIVTSNLRHFPAEVLAHCIRPSIQAIHPDELVRRLAEANVAEVALSVTEHFKSLKKPPKTVEEYVETFRACNMPITANLALKILGGGLMITPPQTAP